MNREEIIRLAREAGLLVIETADGGDAVYTWPQGITDELERFAALVAAAEREECAAIAETHAIDREDEYVCDKIAAAIRARGQT